MVNIFRDFKNGLMNKYPLCCIIAFCLRLSSPGVVCRDKDGFDVYKPCLFHKRYALSDIESLKILNDGECPLPRWNFDENGNYVKEELIRGARTLVGKPITINHDSKRIVGHIIDAEEEENAIEYVGEVNSKTALGREYVQKLVDGKTMTSESYYKKWLKNPIKTPSVEADYRHNRCVQCGQKFYDAETYKSHMWDIHKVKIFKTEPRGILFNALSLVEDPEQPGVPDATLEVLETRQRGMSRLMETLTTDLKKELEYKQKMEKIAVTSTPKRIAIGKARKPKIKEQVPKTDVERAKAHFNISDEEWNKLSDEEKQAYIKKLPPPGTKRAKEQEQTVQDQPEPGVAKPPLPCPEGFEYDPLEGTCKPKESTAEPTADTPAPLIVPTPTIEPAKVVDPTLVTPAQTAGPIIEQISPQQEGQLPPAPFPKTPAEAPAVSKECPEGSHWDEVEGTCVADPIPDLVTDLVKEQDSMSPPVQAKIPSGPATITQECPEGSHYDAEEGTCVPDKIPSEVTNITKEFKLRPKLKLGEAFGGYSSFEDCVAKNQDKDDPEAYCADICRKISGEMVMETTANIYEQQKKHSNASLSRDVKIAETVNSTLDNVGKLFHETMKNKVAIHRLSAYDKQRRKEIVEVVAKHDKAIQNLPNTVNKQLAVEAKLRTKDVNAIKEVVNKTFKGLVQQNQKTNGSLHEFSKQVSEVAKTNNAFVNKKLSELATAIAKLDREIVRNKKDYEKVAHLIEKVKDEEISSLEEKKKLLEQELENRKCPEGEHYDEEQKKCVPNEPKEPEEAEEAKETDKKLTEMATKIENLEAKLKGDFKGKGPQTKKGEPIYKDPYKDKQKKT